MQYRNDIQGLRAIAILLVMAAHFLIPGVAWGFVGVDIFFVISSYLITGLIYEEYTNTAKFNYMNFYARRFRRLLPAMALMILGTLIAGEFLMSPQEHMKTAIVAPFAATWLSNFYFSFVSINYFDAPLQENIFLHTWSLGVEEQFYLVWPVLMIALVNEFRRRADKSSRKELTVAIVVFVLASLVCCISLSYTKPIWAYYMMPTRLWQFALGSVGYFIVASPKITDIQRKYIGRFAPICGLIFIILCGLLISPTSVMPGYLAVLPSLAAVCLLLGGGLAPAGVIAQWLGSRPLCKLGNISYSLYLWHWPVWIFAGEYFADDYVYRIFISIFLSFLLALVSYKLLERPVRVSKYMSDYPRIVVVSAVAGMLIIIFASNVFHAISKEHSHSPQLSLYEDIRGVKPWIYAQGCDKWFYSSEVTPCVYGSESATHVAVIFGDSVGAQWLPAIQAIYNDPDWRVWIFTKSACPIVNEKIFYPRIGRQYTECEIWRENSAQQIRKMKPEVVFVGSAIYPYTQEQWTNGTREMLNRFVDATGQVFIFRSVPALPYDAIDCLTRKKWIGQYIDTDKMCNPKISNLHNREVFDWLKIAVSVYPNVKMLDLNETICPDSVCQLEKNKKIVYRDSQHLSVAFVEELTPVLYQAMVSQ